MPSHDAGCSAGATAIVNPLYPLDKRKHFFQLFSSFHFIDGRQAMASTKGQHCTDCIPDFYIAIPKVVGSKSRYHIEPYAIIFIVQMAANGSNYVTWHCPTDKPVRVFAVR
jgi:hypothetical protein